MMRNKVTKHPVSQKATVPHEPMPLKMPNAAMLLFPKNDSAVEPGEDVCEKKQSRTGDNLKTQYASRLKDKNKDVNLQKKGDVASRAIAVDGSDSDGRCSDISQFTNDSVAHTTKL